MSVLATDITCLDKPGPGVGLNSCAWPVPEAEFKDLVEVVAGELERLCLDLGPEDMDLVLSDGFPFFLVQLEHAAIVAHRCARDGHELKVGALSRHVYHPDWEALATAHQRVLSGGGLNMRFRRLARNAAFGAHLSPAGRVGRFLRPNCTALGSNDRLRRLYVEKAGLGPDNTYIHLLAAGVVPSARALPAHTVARLREFMDGLGRSFVGRYGVSLDMAVVADCWFQRLSMVRDVFDVLRRKAEGSGMLLVTEAAKPLHKLAACAWRSAGAKAVGFHHGHYVGEAHLPTLPYTSLFAYSEFICPSKQAALGHEQEYLDSSIAARRPVKFTSVSRDGQGERGTRNPDLPGKIRTVMIMGFPMNGMRYMGYPGIFWRVQLDLELQLINALSDAGFEVLYKVHPERLSPVADIISSLGCRVVPEPLEQVVEQADAFVVKYSASTTFRTVLSSSRPVYMLDLEKDVWRKEYYELLKRRCVMVKSDTGTDGRVNFDAHGLVSGLSGTQQILDFSYVDKYLWQ